MGPLPSLRWELSEVCSSAKELEPRGCFVTYLEDQSANGTFVNDRVVGKGRKIPLAHVAKIALSLPHNKGRQSLLGMSKQQEAWKTYF